MSSFRRGLLGVRKLRPGFFGELGSGISQSERDTPRGQQFAWRGGIRRSAFHTSCWSRAIRCSTRKKFISLLGSEASLSLRATETRVGFQMGVDDGFKTYQSGTEAC
ncbi:hypothetical protein GN956_G11695 [Arapaima gigas]